MPADAITISKVPGIAIGARQYPRRAFTLIELFVVIGIIVVLIAILLPAFRSVRESSRSAVCLGNLRQIGAGALAYSMQYDGYTVPGYATNYTNLSGQDADAENYATVLVNGRFLTAPSVAKVTAMVGTGSSVFRCPSGTDDFLYIDFSTATGADLIYPTAGRIDGMCGRPLRTVSQSSGIIVDTWYGINSTLDAGILMPCRRLPSAGPLPHITAIKQPSKMVFLYDGIYYNLDYFADRIHARHNFNQNTNILFFDNHAETFSTASLPGGMGPNSTGVDFFSSAVLGNHPTLDWRLDEQ